jgi:chaperonin GroES
VNILNLGARLTLDDDFANAPNLLDRLNQEQITCIAGAVWNGYNRDNQSRTPWMRRNAAGLDLAMQLQKEKNFPWPGASNVIFPLVTISALQFGARSCDNLIQGTDVVRYRTRGNDPQLRARATRISRHMSWQMLEEDEAWEDQHDALLINLAVVGTSFIKTFYKMERRTSVSEMVIARDLVVNYWAKSMESAPRITQMVQLSRNSVMERINQDMFVDIAKEPWFQSYATVPNDPVTNDDQRQGKFAPPADEDTPFTFLEQHRWIDLDGDGYAEPYRATIELGSKKLVRLTARWESRENIIRDTSKRVLSIKATHDYTKYAFIPSPDGGFYGMGFGQFLGPINESVNTAINQLLDNGTMQNSLGGFLGRGAKIRGGVYTMAPWEWKRVDSSGDDLRKNLVPFPERSPSTVTFQLIGLLVQYADRLSGTVEQAVGENPDQNTPAETARSSLSEGLKVYKWIFKRAWRSLKEEAKKRYILNGHYLPSTSTFGNDETEIRREDYLGPADQIAPVADPNVASSEMRIMQATMVKQASMTTNGYDLAVTERKWLKALQVEEMDEIYPGPDKVKPLPNRYVMVEQLKLQGQEAKYKHEKQKWANELIEEKRLNSAKIAQLEAQAIEMLASADATKAGVMIQRFDSAINAAKVYHEALNDRIEALQSGGKDGEEDDGGSSGGGGMGQLETGQGDGGVQDPAQQLAGGAQGAMGGEGVQQ